MSALTSPPNYNHGLRYMHRSLQSVLHKQQDACRLKYHHPVFPELSLLQTRTTGTHPHLHPLRLVPIWGHGIYQPLVHKSNQHRLRQPRQLMPLMSFLQVPAPMMHSLPRGPGTLFYSRELHQSPKATVFQVWFLQLQLAAVH